MKLKALMLALLVAGACSSFALAEDGPGTGTTTAKNGDCRRLELRGSLVAVAGNTFTMSVTKANHGAGALVGTTATLTVDAKTRVKWEGRGLVTGPNAGDRLRVLATQCAATPTTLTAKKVDAATPRGDKTADGSTTAKPSK
jgi:hypothetical protein